MTATEFVQQLSLIQKTLAMKAQLSAIFYELITQAIDNLAKAEERFPPSDNLRAFNNCLKELDRQSIESVMCKHRLTESQIMDIFSEGSAQNKRTRNLPEMFTKKTQPPNAVREQHKPKT